MAKLSVLDLRPEDVLELARLLGTTLAEFEVRAFGSRVTGHAKPYSDLDLAVMTSTPLSLEQLATMTTAFEESDLSIRVDLVDWAATSAVFQEIIALDNLLVHARPAG